MNHGSCGTATLFNLLCILFLFFSGVDAQGDFGILSSRCPHTSTPWWEPLAFKATGFSIDPCEMSGFKTRKFKFSLNCCFQNSNHQQSKREKNDKDSHQSCGPCNLQTYNLASACLACEQFRNSNPPSATDITVNNKFPSFVSWNANGYPSENSKILPLVPQWANTNFSESGMFDVQQVLLAASTGPPASVPANVASIYSGGSSTSSLVPTAPATESPSGSADAAGKSSPKVQAGAIAGGVIGGLLFLAFVALGTFYFLRRRRRHRSAPSAEFMPVSGPSHAQEEEPPQFGPGSWRPPPLEGVHTNTSPYGLMSNPTLWEKDIEKY